MLVFGKDETALSKFAVEIPIPHFDKASFNDPKPLDLAKIAIVTTAALHRIGEPGFELGDSDFHFETLPKATRGPAPMIARETNHPKSCVACGCGSILWI